MAEAKAQTQAGLRRALGRWDLTGLAINGTIGAGILGLPGTLYAALGSWCVLAVLACGVLMGLVAACFAQAGSRFARSGGAAAYAGAAFGPFAGFCVGWLQAGNGLFSFATVANLLLTYLAPLLPGIDTGAPRVLALALMVLGLGGLVYGGVRVSALAANVLTLLKFALLLGFVALAAPALFAHGLPASPWPRAGAWAAPVTTLIFACGGLEAMVVSGGEMRRPARDLPFALALAMALVVAIYALVVLASIASVPDLGHAARPVYDGALRLGGRFAAGAVAWGAAASMAGVLFTILFAAPRVVFALAEAGHLPAPLARVDVRFRTPGNAILAVALAGFGLAAASSFSGAIVMAAVTRLAGYAATAAAALALTRRGVSETAEPLRLPGGQAISVAAFILCVALLAQNTRKALGEEALLLAAGAAIYAMEAWRRRRGVGGPAEG